MRIVRSRKGQYGIRINDQWRVCKGDTALRLGHFFGTSPQFWLNLQSLYELRLAEQKAGKSVRILPTLKKQTPGSPHDRTSRHSLRG